MPILPFLSVPRGCGDYLFEVFVSLMSWRSWVAPKNKLASEAGIPFPIPTFFQFPSVNLFDPHFLSILRYVATAMSVACQVNWASNFVVGIGWPHMQQIMGPYSFATFGTLLLATFLFTLFYLPETAGRTVAEVQLAANDLKATCCGSCCCPEGLPLMVACRVDMIMTIMNASSLKGLPRRTRWSSWLNG